MNIRSIWLLLIALCTLLPLSAQAGNGRKVALVIANGAYLNATSLTNPKNDAALVAASAKKAGFTTVTLSNDLGLQQFQRALRDFRDQAAGADVAMVYYAGHGIEGSGKNWLLPVDAQLKGELDLPYEAIDLDRVMESISGADLRMVILDACRNNPFGRSWRSGTRAVTRGLGDIQVDDVLVIYAAAPGQTAADGDGTNSPFATSLAKRLAEPGVAVQFLGGLVRDDVLASTGGTQRPFVTGSITGTPVYLIPQAAAKTAVATEAAVAASPQIDSATVDMLTWQGALGAASIAGFEEYKAQFPQGRFVKLADQNIIRLRSVAAPTPRGEAPASVSPAPARVRTEAAAAQTTTPGKLAPPALIFPQSSRQLLTRADVQPLEPVQLWLARNEIFARHGFIFNRPELQQYFGRFDWYQPVGRQVKLNAIEQANVALLQAAERVRGTRN